MRLIIFENKGLELLYPLTYLRAACELRCGHTTLGEKIQRSVGSISDTSYFVRDILAPTFKQRYTGCAVNETTTLQGDDLLLIDGRILAMNELPVPDGEGVISYGGTPVIVKVYADTAASLPTNDIGTFLTAAQVKLPAVDKQVTLMEYPWDLIHYNPEAITIDFKFAGKSGIEGSIDNLSCIYGPEDQCYIAPGAEIHPMVVIDTKGGPVTIERDAIVFPHSRIEGPCYIGVETQIVGGKIREGCSFGPLCRVGGEVEEAIIHGYSNKYHDGFLGHAYVGEWVNLGALTTNSDLKNDYSNVEVKIGKTTYDSGSTKVGSFIGDHTKTSIGTLLNTGSTVGIMCLLMATGAPLPKYIPSFMWYVNGRFSKGAGFKSLLKTAHAAMSRRKRSLTDEDVALLEAVNEMTKEERDPLIKRDSKAMIRRK
ncbi:putative sugar nucleotidyl transferase [Candidatus Latescibacterota bacterium]